MTDIGLLLLRVAAGGLLFISHGWGKLLHFSQAVATFPDPLHLGHSVSLVLVIFAEVFCSIAVVLGLFTRKAAIPPVIMMVVATFIVHRRDSWSARELPILYLVMFLTLAFSGAGTYSIDWMFRKKR